MEFVIPNPFPSWSPRGSVLVTPWRGLLAVLGQPDAWGSCVLAPALVVDCDHVPLPVCVHDERAGGWVAVGELDSFTLDKREGTLRGRGHVETWAVLDHLDEQGRAAAGPLGDVSGTAQDGVVTADRFLLQGVLLGGQAFPNCAITIGPAIATATAQDLELARAS